MEKNFKFLVAAGGVIAAIGIFLPYIKMGELSISLFDARKAGGGQFWMVVIGILVAAGAGIAGVVKGKMDRALAGVALVGAALALIKVREGLSWAIGGKLMFIGTVLAVVGAIAVLAKPEQS